MTASRAPGPISANNAQNNLVMWSSRDIHLNPAYIVDLRLNNSNIYARIHGENHSRVISCGTPEAAQQTYQRLISQINGSQNTRLESLERLERLERLVEELLSDRSNRLEVIESRLIEIEDALGFVPENGEQVQRIAEHFNDLLGDNER